MGSERRFLIPPDELPDAAGTTAVLSGPEHHHLSRVLRLKEGDAVSLFDGEGRGYDGVIESVGKDATRIRLGEKDRRSVEPSLRVVLAQAIPHHDKMDLVVQKTTEIGVAVIVPILSQRSVMRPGPASGRRLERWRRIVAEAARQSGRLAIPEVASPVPWTTFLEGLADDGSDRLILSPAAPDSEGWGPAAGGSRGAILAIGPEGGWSPEEEKAATERGFRAVSLGGRVLRAETAAIVAAALALHAAGDLGPGPASS